MTGSKRALILAIQKGYTIDKDGLVTNPKLQNVVGRISSIGYRVFGYRLDNIRTFKIPFHRLQAYQKYGEAMFEEGIVVRHLNGIKTDNSWDNILIGTISQNRMDIPKEVRLRAALIATSFWRKHDKEAVKKSHKEIGFKKTMEKFDIKSKGTMSYIINH